MAEPGAKPKGTLRLTLAFLPVGLALFLIQLDFFSLNLALPTIAADLNTPVTDLQWLISGYLLALGSLLIPAGRLGEVFGRRNVLLAGIAIFGLMSLVCGLTSSVPLLIGARIAQGAGAALIMPTALAIVTNATDEQVRPRIIGALLGIAGVGTALGPVVGGVLASTAGWRWVFLINVPVAGYALWRGRRLTESRDEHTARSLAGLDWWGIGTIVLGLALVSIAIDDVAVEGWTSVATLGPLLAGVALLGAFALNETRAAAPMVRPSLVRNRLYLVLTIAGTIANIGSCVFIFVATLDLQDIRGLSAAESGLLFVFASIGLASCGPLGGWLSVRYPPGIVMAVALLLGAPALTLLAFVQPLPIYVAVLVLCGVTTNMGFNLGQLAVQNVLPPQRSAEGTSVLLTLLISVAGMSVVAASAVIEWVGDQQVTIAGIATVLVAVAVLLLASGLVTLTSEARRLRSTATATQGSAG